MKKIKIEGWIAIIMGLLATLIAIFVKEVHDYIIDSYMNLVFISFIIIAVIFGTIAYIKHKYSVLKNKVIALKDFRDKEMVRIIDHYNAQLKEFEIRFSKLEPDKKTDTVTDDPQLLLHENENNKQKEREVIEYNEAFKDWGISSYGLGHNTSIYKGKNFETK